MSPPNQEQKLRPLEPKTFSAAQRWLKKHPGKEKLAERVSDRFAVGLFYALLLNKRF